MTSSGLLEQTLYLESYIPALNLTLSASRFKGKIFKGHTLIPILERFEEQFSIGHPTVVADAGIVSALFTSKINYLSNLFIIISRILPDF